MNILVFNCGSSSLSFKIFEVGGDGSAGILLKGKAHRVGVTGTEAAFVEFHPAGGESVRMERPLETHRLAAAIVLQFVRDHNFHLDAIGHRFVHGGNQFDRSAELTADALKRLYACLPLAPIHNPISMSVIEESRSTYSDLTQYATFDTAFHAPIPERASVYALPERVRRLYGFRRYGFHGLSYTYVSRVAAEFLGLPPGECRMVACHLGTGGSSVAAIRGGKSVDTSMGFSPLAGLVMSTRSGDLDPALILALMTNFDLRPEDLEDLLNRKSGLIGLSLFSSDLRDILKRIRDEEQPDSKLAFSMYCHRIRKYIGAYTAVLGGVDALVYTDDIGLTNPHVRERVCEGLAWAGIELDAEANHGAAKSAISVVSAKSSRVPVLTVPTDEEVVIAWEGRRLFEEAKS